MYIVQWWLALLPYSLLLSIPHEKQKFTTSIYWIYYLSCKMPFLWCDFGIGLLLNMKLNKLSLVCFIFRQKVRMVGHLRKGKSPPQMKRSSCIYVTISVKTLHVGMQILTRHWFLEHYKNLHISWQIIQLHFNVKQLKIDANIRNLQLFL